MRKKISIYAFVITALVVIFSLCSLLAFPLGIAWWKAEIISVCSGLSITAITLFIETLVYVSKRNA